METEQIKLPSNVNIKFRPHQPATSVFNYLIQQSADCLFSVEGQNITAHKTVLRAFSPVFDKLFIDQAEQLAEDSKIDLLNLKWQDFIDILMLLYNGEVEIEEPRWKSFNDTIKQLQINLPETMVKLVDKLDCENPSSLACSSNSEINIIKVESLPTIYIEEDLGKGKEDLERSTMLADGHSLDINQNIVKQENNDNDANMDLLSLPLNQLGTECSSDIKIKEDIPSDNNALKSEFDNELMKEVGSNKSCYDNFESSFIPSKTAVKDDFYEQPEEIKLEKTEDKSLENVVPYVAKQQRSPLEMVVINSPSSLDNVENNPPLPKNQNQHETRCKLTFPSSSHDDAKNIPQPLIQCQFCYFPLQSDINRKQHENRCKLTFRVLYTCTICMQEFIRARLLKSHMCESHNVILHY